MSGAGGESMTYIGRNQCGCVGLLVVDNPEHARDVAKEIGRAIRQGMSVERVKTGWVRSKECSLAPCPDAQPCVRDQERRRRRKAEGREP